MQLNRHLDSQSFYSLYPSYILAACKSSIVVVLEFEGVLLSGGAGLVPGGGSALPMMALPATCCPSFPESRIHPPKIWPKNWTPSSRNWSRQNPKVSNNCQLNFSLNFLNFSFTIQRFSPSFQYSSSVFSLATTATSFFVAAAVSTFFLAVVLLSLFYLSISFSPISLTCHDSELILYFFVHFD